MKRTIKILMKTLTLGEYLSAIGRSKVRLPAGGTIFYYFFSTSELPPLCFYVHADWQSAFKLT